MTEIPEHLLKRAAERRAAMTGGAAPEDSKPAADAPAGAGAPAAAAAVEPKAKATAPLPSLEEDAPKAKPDSAVVAAAKSRKRIPFYAAAVLALLPLWAMLYLYSVQPPPAGENDPLVIGAEVYTANCQSCHQGDGSGINGGGTGQQLSEGHVIDTFADPLSMAHWVAYGTSGGGANADGTYGDPGRPGGAMRAGAVGTMPGFASSLSADEIAAAIIYIRQALSGGDPADDPNVNVETYEADHAAVVAMVQAAIDLGPDNTDVSEIPGAETGDSAAAE